MYIILYSAVFVRSSIFLYVFPFVSHSQNTNFTSESATPHTPAPPLMNWKTMNKLLPWSTLLLIGGGMSMAEGIKVRAVYDGD